MIIAVFIASAQDTALILGAIAAVIVALGNTVAQGFNAWLQVRNQRIIAEKIEAQAKVLDNVHEQVTTINGKTIAVIADEGETRRIEGIPAEDRTAAEREHIDVVPPPEDPP